MPRPSRTPYVLVLAALFTFTVPAAAEWIPLGPDATQLRVLSDDGSRIRLELEIAGVERTAVQANGQVTDAYTLPGEAALMDVGAPQLPVIRRAVALPDRGAFTVRVLSLESTTLSTAPVTPSKGHLKRTQSPTDVPFIFGPAYERAGFYPEVQAELLDPFIVRDARGAVIELRPFRYDAVAGVVEVATRMELEVVPSSGAEINPFLGSHGPVDRDFAPIYDDLFVNSGSHRYSMFPEPGRCLIVTHESLHSAADALYQWKLQKGVPTTLVDLGTIGTSSAAIKSYLQNLYNGAGVTYVILVGDIQQIPTMYGDGEGAPSDVTYSRLAGTDYYPDIIISRISAQTLTQAEYQITKLIRYEKTPDLAGGDDAWYSKGVGIGSAEGDWSGYTDCERTQLLRDMLMAYTYDGVDQICDPTATKAQLIASINAGKSILNYIGHGSGSSWGTTGFSSGDVPQLQNGYKDPFVLDVSCSNGGFHNGECFAEAWMRNGSVSNPRGAISWYGSSLLCDWIPPCDMQSEAVRVLTQEERRTIGGASMAGIMKALDLWPGNTGIRLFEEYNILGDGSLWLRTDQAAPLSVEHEGLLPAGATSYQVTVPETPEALVSIYANGVRYGSAYTDPNGVANVVLEQQPPAPSTVQLTVSAFNHETHVEDLLVDNPSLAHLLINSFNAVDSGQGTTNGRIEAGEQVALSLVLTNDGLEDAHAVQATLTPVGPWATMLDDQAAFGEIAMGATASSDAPYLFNVSPNVPDMTSIQFLLDIHGTGGHWTDTVSLIAHTPAAAIASVIVDDVSTGNGDGQLNPGETANLLVNLHNSGSGDAALLSGNIASRTIQVAVLQNHGELPSLPAGGDGALSPSFTVRANPLMPPALVGFDLWLSGGNQYATHLVFNLQMGYSPTAVEPTAIDEVALLSPSPNPAPGRTRVAFALPRAQSVDLSVFDPTGRRVATLARGAQEPGLHASEWNGRDDAGHPLASGVYLVRLTTGDRTLVSRVALIR